MKNKISIPDDIIENKIFLIRGKKVMFDRDLAVLYGVETRILNQAVRRNKDRFPEDFMFQLFKSEFNIWKSQIVISNVEKMGLRKMPLVFTEQGVAMLSSVLKSKRAIQVNIQIMRTFTKIREMIINNKELRLKIETMERKYDNKFQAVFDAIKKILIAQAGEKPSKSNKIGFKL
ncbi:MAG TPA: DNA-binding protein [Candidatus Moranbacteria bacterium]|nr:MAG: KilA-N, DNA-binding domain protein [Candidatus Moranbacteria bacterium GW2011_GWF1_34_10]HBI17516.1 DNA-binding protein [Candidatus Moranbacteria bacterium]